MSNEEYTDAEEQVTDDTLPRGKDEIGEFHTDAQKIAEDPSTYVTYKSASVRTGYGIITSLGLPLPSPPSVEARDWELPQALNEIADEELSQHMSMWTNLLSYAMVHEAELQSNVDAIDATITDRTNALLLNTKKDRNVTLADRKAEVAMDTKIRQLTIRYTHMKAAHRMIKALMLGYEAKYKAVSREVTRRDQQGWKAT